MRSVAVTRLAVFTILAVLASFPGSSLDGQEVGSTTVVPAALTSWTLTKRPEGGGDGVYVEATHPADRVLTVTWNLNGKVVPNPRNARSFDLGSRTWLLAPMTPSAALSAPGAESFQPHRDP